MTPCFSVKRCRRLIALLTAGLWLAGSAGPAFAWVSVGVGIPIGPIWPPAYYPPPVYYPPPPVYYAPPQVYAPPVQPYTPPPYTPPPHNQARAYTGQMCYAGAYTCPMERTVAPGSSCYCRGNSGQQVWGQAN